MAISTGSAEFFHGIRPPVPRAAGLGSEQILGDLQPFRSARRRWGCDGADRHCGSCCDVESTKHGNAIWFVVHVDDDVDVVDTNVGNLFGGIVGSIARPLAAANIS